MQLPRTQKILISFVIAIFVILCIGGEVVGFAAIRLIAQHLVVVESLLSNQQKSIDALNAVPANQSSIADANPGFIQIHTPPNATAPTLGKPDAPVKIVEYADFQCPYCEKFFQQSEPKLISQYVDTGKAQLIFENFPFLGNESELAAEAGACAQDQGQFWPYHDYLYQHQAPENSGSITIKSLEFIASGIQGINEKQFDSCLSTHADASRVQKQLSDAVALGVSSTPTILINGKEFSGVYDTSEYDTAINTILTYDAKPSTK